MEARIVSIQVGLPKRYGGSETDKTGEREWVSGIAKQRVDGPVFVGRLNLAGDGQADLVYHGGPDRPVLMYAADHYAQWREELPRPFEYGAFGENLTVTGLEESSVCIGDIYRIGDLVLEVSQPRNPCWKLASRHGIPDLAARVEATSRTGWYLRVLQEAFVEAGMMLERVARPYPEWTIVRARQVYRARREQKREAAMLAECPALSADWREALRAALKH
ncbi:molybdenum cofactor biosynthesis protein [Alicyclobacillus contaminans]|uniref:MOSC domain-containing protein n=1 Tax=Alicyclobacillus contaminans TaxID=392016 RepID=UPI00040B239C|nr:MOSC domain-containing protein [Alicyclobacillus contaminans]GMA49667.1 molybdenum cofactor biosynthesis protein [Alicyclobacillus contaminans]